MKTLSFVIASAAIIFFSSCSKEASIQSNNLISAKITSESASRSAAPTVASATTTIGFDDQVYDNDVIVKTGLVYTPKIGAATILDSASVFMNGNYSNSYVSTEDVLKPSEMGIDRIAVLRTGQLCDIEKRQLVAVNYADTIQLSMRYSYTSYKLQIQPLQFSTGLSLSLYDSYLNTSTSLSITGVSQVPVNVTSPGNSSTRFKLIVRRS